MSAPYIPVIDISSFLDGSDLVTPARAVDEAACTSGFFQITGHGVDEALLEGVYAAAEQLAHAPAEVTARLVSPSGHPYRGLMSMRDKSGFVCSQRFHASVFDDAADAISHGVAPESADFFAPNVWPELAGFREAVSSLFAQTRQLGTQLMRLFAVALDLPRDYFDPYLGIDSSSCSINYYPPRGRRLEVDPTVIFDEHCDGGTLTVLHQRGTYDGLQIKTLDGEWFSVPVVANAFVVNMGELMTRWTNDRWPATRHRVIASADPRDHRTTLTTFHLPSVTTPIVPLLVAGQTPHYEPVTVHEWENRFIQKTFAQRQHTSVDPATQQWISDLEAPMPATPASG